MNEPTLLAPARRRMALQRITALWAFCESGLGGIFHALRMPFTGLIVGSFAVLSITLLAWLARDKPRQVLHSLLLVLLVKAVASPHSPPTAYLAVAFQGLLGYLLFATAGVRSITVFLLAVLAMIESALQKLLTLTLFFGKSLWKATDEFLAFTTRELHLPGTWNSTDLAVTYVSLYIAGGLICGWFIVRLLRNFETDAVALDQCPEIRSSAREQVTGRRRQKKYLVTLLLLAFVCGTLFLSAANTREGTQRMLQALGWTISALTIWYGLLAPLLLRALHRFLKKKGTPYQGEVQALLNLLPAMRRIALAAWHTSASRKGLRRMPYFVRLLVHWTLAYETVETQSA